LVLSPAEWEAIRLSTIIAGTAVVGGLPFGIALGWLFARKSFWGKTLLETLVNFPLVLPPVVTGFLLLLVFGRNGLLGGYLEQWFGLRLVFDWKGAALAAGVVSFPLMVRAIRIGFHTVDRRIEQVARTLGAGRIDVFFTVSLPLARHGVISGCVLAFARGIGEFGATIMIAGNIPGQTQTIPLFIYNQFETPGGMENAMPIVVASILISGVALMVGNYLERRDQESRGT
jgi:molybdate transport system permease protein